RAGDQDLVGGAEVGAPVDVEAGAGRGERAGRVQHDEDVGGGGAFGGQAAARGAVDGTPHPGEGDAVAGGERGDAADTGDHLVSELRLDLFQGGEGAVVDPWVAPNQKRAGLAVGEFVGDEGFVDPCAVGAPVLDGGRVRRGGAVAFRVADLDDPVGGTSVRFDEVVAQPGQVVLGLALVDDEEDVGGRDGLGRLE